MKTLRNTLLVALALLASGCGYALVGRSSTLPEDIKNIFISALDNATTRTQVDQLLTDAIVDEFVTRQRFKVVASRGEADAVLSGTVRAFTSRPVILEAEGRATSLEIVIGTDVRFERTDNDEVIWERDNYYFRDTYDVDVSVQNYFSREDEAIEAIAERFAETLVIDLLEGF